MDKLGEQKYTDNVLHLAKAIVAEVRNSCARELGKKSHLRMNNGTMWSFEECFGEMLFPTMIENGGMEVLLHLNDQKCEKWGNTLDLLPSERK